MQGSIDPVGCAEWDRIRDELQLRGLLDRVDQAAIVGYCLSWQHWMEAEAKLQAESEVITAPSGHPVQSPWLWIADKHSDRVMEYLTRFGLVPGAGRNRFWRRPIANDLPPVPEPGVDSQTLMPAHNLDDPVEQLTMQNFLDEQQGSRKRKSR